jgi:hypothetical protein
MMREKLGVSHHAASMAAPKTYENERSSVIGNHSIMLYPQARHVNSIGQYVVASKGRGQPA